MIGFLNIDKPQGITSHDVVNRVRRVAGTRKVGHAGTLDPLATGVLIVGVNRATRLIEYIVGQPKTYLTIVRLGQTTNTYDADGDIEQECSVAVSDAELSAALTQFRGEIEQTPPMFSAIKQNGKPLYLLARKGQEVKRKPRRVVIDQLDVVERNENDVTLRVGCSTGTYIRSLAHDLGQVLGCGGHVKMLRRERVGGFSVETATPLDELTAENIASKLHPLEIAVSHLPRFDASEVESAMLRVGKRIERRDDLGELVRAYAADGTFLGILRERDENWQPHKLFV